MLKVNNRAVEEEKVTRGVKHHWRYHLNLLDTKINLKPERYECIVTLLYDDQTITFSNEFLYNGDFIFAEELKKASVNVL